MTTPLSPSAQAVRDAYKKGGLDAALRAAADQVVPETDTIDKEEWIGQSAWQQAEQRVRFRFLALAAELKGADPCLNGSPYLFDTSTKDQKPPPRLV